MEKFRITWERGGYYVSIPNYDGGEVYKAEDVDKHFADVRQMVEEMPHEEDCTARVTQCSVCGLSCYSHKIDDCPGSQWLDGTCGCIVSRLIARLKGE